MAGSASIRFEPRGPRTCSHCYRTVPATFRRRWRRTALALPSARTAVGTSDLYVMDSDGRNLRRLTTDAGNEGDPAWTPDGAQIVYTFTRRNHDSDRHYLRGWRRVPAARPPVPAGTIRPSVSPDGQSIAFISVRDGNQEVYAMNLDGANQRRLTKTSERESCPRILPQRGPCLRSRAGWPGKGIPGHAPGLG